MIENMIMTEYFNERIIKIIYDSDKQIYDVIFENVNFSEERVKDHIRPIFEKRKINSNNFKKFVGKIFDYKLKIHDKEIIFDDRVALTFPIDYSVNYTSQLYKPRKEESFRDVLENFNKIIRNFDEKLSMLIKQHKIESFICGIHNIEVVFFSGKMMFVINGKTFEESKKLYKGFIKLLEKDGFEINNPESFGDILYDKKNNETYYWRLIFSHE